MLISILFHEITGKFDRIILEQDDRTYESSCRGKVHEFPPGSKSCVCQKYEDIDLIKPRSK